MATRPSRDRVKDHHLRLFPSAPLGAALLLCLALAAPAAGATVQGRSATSTPGFVRSADGAVRGDRLDGYFVAARRTGSPFRVDVRRLGGATEAIAVQINASDDLAYDRGLHAYYLSGVEWSPTTGVTLTRPGGGTLRVEDSGDTT